MCIDSYLVTTEVGDTFTLQVPPCLGLEMDIYWDVMRVVARHASIFGVSYCDV